MTEQDMIDVDRGPRRVAVQAVVNAPAPELFALIADPHRHHEADGSGWVQPEVIGPRDLREGDRFRVSMKFFGKMPYSMTNTVTEVVQDRVVEWRPFGGHRWRWEFEPVDGGSTRVTEIFDYSTSKLAPLLERFGSVDNDRRMIRASLRRLQQQYRS